MSKSTDKPSPEVDETAPEVTAAVTEAEMKTIVRHTKQLLDLQPKRTCRIRPDASGSKGPNFETVCVNGYVFQIQKGAEVSVPQTVYDLLAEASLI